MQKIIYYTDDPKTLSWNGGFISSRPCFFPTLMFEENNVFFENFKSSNSYKDDDIFYLLWNDGGCLNDTQLKFLKNHRCIIGGKEAYCDQWKEYYINLNNPNLLFLFSSQGINTKNKIFLEKYWWILTYFNLVDADYNLLNGITSTKTLDKKFLLPIRTTEGPRTWRLEFYGSLVDHLDDSLFSRHDLELMLDHSLFRQSGSEVSLGSDHRENLFSDMESNWNIMQANPEWYSKTHFSIVLETYIKNEYPIFITEKTFKPIANEHPFMIASVPRTLDTLRSWGFETFNNLFDESYDDLIYESTDIRKKVQIIKKNVDNYDYSKYYDSTTLKKIKHNRELFFNLDEIKKHYTNDFLFPILDWINPK